MPRDQVFISYSHEDTKWREDLEKNLKPYLRDGSITSWSDEEIKPGSQWFAEIKSALTNTKVAVLLVTPDFLASDFIHEHELGPLLKEAERGGVTILWVLIYDSAYKETELKNYQAVLDPGKPLGGMTKTKRGQAWVKICEEIKSALALPPAPPPPFPPGDWSQPETRAFASDEVRKSLKEFNSEAAFAIDDGIALYMRPDMSVIPLEDITVVCDTSYRLPHNIVNPTSAVLLSLNHSKNVDAIAKYLRKQAETSSYNKSYTTKVGLRQIDFPISRADQPLRLHFEPLSYWTIDIFNRAMLRPGQPEELRILRAGSLSQILQSGQQVPFPCPSAFYIEVSIITNDDKIVIVEKNPRQSDVAISKSAYLDVTNSKLKHINRKWTCTLEEGLVWEHDVQEGKVLFREALERGLQQELKIDPTTIDKVTFYAIALEHTHLNSALLGTVWLRMSSEQLRKRIQESEDFGMQQKCVSLSEAGKELFSEEKPEWKGWHPTGRMRALLTLYHIYGRNTVKAELFPSHR